MCIYGTNGLRYALLNTLKSYYNPISMFIFNRKIYSLCQNNIVSQKIVLNLGFKYYIGLLFS